jgi:hypothetical protein
MSQAINYRASASNILYKKRAGVIVLLLPLGMAAGAPILTKVNILVEKLYTFLNSQAVSVWALNYSNNSAFSIGLTAL